MNLSGSRYLDARALNQQMLRTDVPVIQNPFNPNRWFITIGNPGFNSPTNNALGFKSKAAAEAAIRHYASKPIVPA